MSYGLWKVKVIVEHNENFKVVRGGGRWKLSGREMIFLGFSRMNFLMRNVPVPFNIILNFPLHTIYENPFKLCFFINFYADIIYLMVCFAYSRQMVVWCAELSPGGARCVQSRR